MKRLKSGLNKTPVLGSLARACRFAPDPRYRSEQRLMRTRPDKLFQPYARTGFDRHPALFGFGRDALPCAGVLPDQGGLRILSYGCSTGEEVLSLRQYFPTAEITGIDINPGSISICRRKQAQSGDARMRFVHAATPQGEPAAAYDAVFCLSVLRHGELGARQPASCGHLIRFADTSAAADFEAVYRMGGDVQRDDTPLYGADERRLAGVAYNDVIFRKRAAA